MKEALAELSNVMSLEQQKPARFLAAWKRGVKLAGEEYFNVVGSVEGATDKEQLRPNYKMIEHSLFKISSGQATFLAALYSFFNGEEGQLFLEQLGKPNISDLAAYLDRERAEIISELFLTYSGW